MWFLIKIVCKVLSNNGKSLNLSLRRVSLKEKQEIMKGYKQKMSIKSAFKQYWVKIMIQ